jgi:hypothetical protein
MFNYYIIHKKIKYQSFLVSFLAFLAYYILVMRLW